MSSHFTPIPAAEFGGVFPGGGGGGGGGLSFDENGLVSGFSSRLSLYQSCPPPPSVYGYAMSCNGYIPVVGGPFFTPPTPLIIRYHEKSGRFSFCAFCKKNGEDVSFYESHFLKDICGNVVCPILAKYVCPFCFATGPRAHTVKYCWKAKMVREKKNRERSEYCEPERKAISSSSSHGDDKNDSSDQKDNSSSSEKQPPLDANYSYDSNNVLVYTDPTTRTEYVLNPDGSDWVKKDEGNVSTVPPPNNEMSSSSDYSFDGKTYGYVDKEGNKFRWDLDKKEWSKQEEEKEEEEESEEDEETTEEQRRERSYRKRKAQPGWGQQGSYFTDESTGAQLYRDPKDGMTYEWDKEKNAWFPKIDEDFMAQYQMNYGFTKDGKAEPTRPDAPKEESSSQPSAEEKKSALAKQKQQEQPQQPAKWFDEDAERTTKVYVTNLPADIDEEKFTAFMSKCGMIDVDVRTNKPKIKIYRDRETSKPKGDALCTYIKVESVSLALQILDGSVLDGQEVKVERAKFEMKGERYDPKLKPKKLKKKELEMMKKKHEKLFEWQPDQLRGERSKRDKVIVIKNLFDPSEFDSDAAKILDYSKQLRENCAKFGQVRRVVVYDKNPEGVAQVFFSSASEADLAIEMMHGRLFSSRLMKVETWDGKTKFKITETKEEEKARLEQWDKFLEKEEEEDEEDKEEDESMEEKQSKEEEEEEAAK